MLSIIIPCHNDGMYLEEAIKSVVAQDFKSEYEIIIVNDRSTDAATIEALQKSETTYDYVKVVDSSALPGPAGARNSGVKRARGEWIAFLDADDSWPPGSLSARWDAVSVIGARWIGGDYALWREQDGCVSQGHFASHPQRCGIFGDDFLSGKCYVRLKRPVKTCINIYIPHTGTVLVKRDLFNSIGGFNESLRQSEDWYMWVRLASETDLLFVPKLTLNYRVREGSLTRCREQFDKYSIKACKKMYMDPHLREYKSLISGRMGSLFLQKARRESIQGYRVSALMSFAVACWWEPWLAKSAWKTLRHVSNDQLIEYM